MTKLSDTQSILLSNASCREGGSLWPAPETLTAPKPAIAKSFASLLARGLAEERETSDASSTHRTDGDLRYGVFITAAGLEAIGLGAGNEAPPVLQPAATQPPRATKTEAVLDLLRRGEGATLAELIETTGWLPHTTRAALTGLRKKGHVLDKSKRGADTCYRILSAA